MARKLKVFLSSTAQDLTAFRKAVHARLAASPLFECIRQEDFGAQPHPAPAVCKAEVEKSELFVGLIGMRRGWEPPDDNPKCRSITEMEYDWAKDVAPRFMYVAPENFPVPGNLRETRAQHQRHLAFRRRIMSELVVSQDSFVSQDGFASPEALAILIVDRLTDHVLKGEHKDPLETLPDAVAARIMRLLDERGDLRKAARGGLERDIVLKLAKRIKPDDNLDFDRAVAELENAITIALDAIVRGRRGSNEDDFVNDVLKSVAAHTQAGDNERAGRELDSALKELDAREAEQRETVKRSRLTLLEAGIAQDLLRRDPKTAAQRVARIVAIEHPNDSAAQFKALSRRWQTFWDEGRVLNLSLEVGIELGLAELGIADTADRRGTALNHLGIVLQELGARESSPLRLEEAVAAYREALKESTRERVPLEWAITQNNLGNALKTLGERESDTARLQEAVTAYREALKERTRERAPLDWAMTQNNLGTALQRLGMRESGTDRLQEAVTAFRQALKEYTRERAPLNWAMTQNNLGTALQSLGEREPGAAYLQEAAAAFCEALKEYTRERGPLQWAMSYGNQGAALRRLADRRSDAGMAATALGQIEHALAVMREASHAPFAEYYEAELLEARTIRDRLNKATSPSP